LVKRQDGEGVFTSYSYYIRSSVLGGKIIKMNVTNASNFSYIYYPDGTLLARAADDGDTRFEYSDPLTGTTAYQASLGLGFGKVEANPLGQDVGTYDPGPDDPGDVGQYPEPHRYGNAEDPSTGCVIDGIWQMCNPAQMLRNGGVIPAALERFQGWSGFSFESMGSGIFRTTIPDIITNNSGEVWTQPPGTRAEGWRIFEGGIFVSSWNPVDSRGGQPPIRHPEREIWRERQKIDCDTFLSNLFGDPGAYFFDNTTHQVDSIMGDRLGFGLEQGVDSHLYGSKTDPTKSTNIYVPPGFEPIIPSNNFASKFPAGQEGATRNKYIGRENYSDGGYKQNYLLFYNRELNLTLAIWHVDNYKLEKQADGRTKVGTIGFSNLSGGTLEGGGGHAHFDLYFSPNGPRSSLPRPSDRPRVRRSFRVFCP
jgi:hypothetical protein